MAGIGTYVDGANIPRETVGTRLVDAAGNPLVLMVSDDGELFTSNTERERNVRVSLSGTNNSAGTFYYGFIDLSDTVNWPHDTVGRLDFSYVSLLIDKASSARGTVSLGIITRIDGTNADISYIATSSFLQNDTGSVEIIANFSPSQLKCEVVAGKLSKVKTSNVETNVAAVHLGQPLSFGSSSFTPQLGDAVVRVVSTTGGNLAWGMSAFYHSHPGIGA